MTTGSTGLQEMSMVCCFCDTSMPLPPTYGDLLYCGSCGAIFKLIADHGWFRYPEGYTCEVYAPVGES